MTRKEREFTSSSNHSWLSKMCITIAANTCLTAMFSKLLGDIKSLSLLTIKTRPKNVIVETEVTKLVKYRQKFPIFFPYHAKKIFMDKVNIWISINTYLYIYTQIHFYVKNINFYFKISFSHFFEVTEQIWNFIFPPLLFWCSVCAGIPLTIWIHNILLKEQPIPVH